MDQELVDLSIRRKWLQIGSFAQENYSVEVISSLVNMFEFMAEKIAILHATFQKQQWKNWKVSEKKFENIT